MSYISPPRLTFSGQSYANASTANNNDIASVYDIDTMTLNPQIGLMTGGQSVDPPPPGGNTFNWGGPTDNPGLRTWLMGLMAASGVDNVGQAQMAHWNYYGDHNTQFQNTTITNAVMETGAAADASDPVHGVQVELLGNIFYGKRRGAVLVDVDPYALVTSQVFTGQFKLTYNAAGNVSIPLLEADNPTVAYSYFINPFKNLNPSCTGFEPVSAIFQFGLPLDSLNFYAGTDFVSSAFAGLNQRAKAAGGLMVRFCLYDAIFQISAPDLYAEFAKGDYVFNPYQGRVLGSIGVWDPDEVPNAPPGRKLNVQSRFTYTPPPPDLAPAEMAVKHQRMAMVAKYHVRKKSAAAAAPPTATLGITLACVDTAKSIVSLDCISTFPEANIQARDKYDLGPINLLLFYGNPPGASVLVGPVPYDKATYESDGGVVEVSYAGNPNQALINANIGTGRLALNSATLGNLLFETAGTDTQTADRAVYFDAQVGEGPHAPAGTSEIALQVTCKGAAPTAPVTVNLEYWMCEKDLVNPDKPQVPVVNPYFAVAGAVDAPPTTYTLGYLAGNPSYPNGRVSVLTQSIQVPAGGQRTLPLTALRPGVSMIRFVDPNLQPAPSPNFAWDNCDFAIVRILPYNDYSTYSDQQINSWPFIYAHFFGFYSVLYPVMSKVIPWGPADAPEDPIEVARFATQMLAFTDPKLWDSTVYMPITRDLSAGKRALLWRWCNLQLQQPT